jgi:type I restriction enzyme S subunit
MSEVKNIPKHWEVKKLGEVADYLNGRAFKPSEWERTGKPIIRIQNLNKEAAVYNYTSKEFEDKYKIEKGDLLYAWSASLGVYIWKGDKAWLNQHIFKVVPKNNCDKKYLFYTLEKITVELYAKAHGSGMVHVTKGKFEETEIPFPPLPEQQAIVSKIEELLSDLENGKQQLQTAQQQLKVYRQSLLKWAFEGKLTNAENKITIVPFGSIVKVVSGNTPKGLEAISNKGSIQFYKVSDMNLEGNEIEMRTTKFYLTKEEVAKLKIKIYPKGTVIFPKRGGAILTNKKRILFSDSSFDLNLMGALPNKDVSSKFLYYWFQKLDLGKIYDGSNVPQINNKNIEPLDFPKCSIEEQQRIVAELESKLTVCDKIEETISQSLQQAETLRQSILKKAFEGKLVQTEVFTSKKKELV